jgi:hypothetical protein
MLYWRPKRRRRRASRRRLSSLVGPVDVCFWALAAALVAAAVRLITGNDSTALSIAQFALTVVLMAYVVLFIDIAMSPVSEGANANASGVAALLELSRRLVQQPPEELDVWLVFPAAEEGFMVGMRRWMRDHAEELDPRRTYFVNVEAIGAGEVHHVTGEGFALIYRHDHNLIRLCEQLGSQPRTWRTGTDGVIPAMQGFPSVTICCADELGRVPNHRRTSDTVENIDEDSLDRAVYFIERLLRKIDELAVRRVGQDQAPA